ncbi:Sodium-dependent glucose transporter 1 [Frankliniella fusca]|uniref:Sodium-dependent glucose transporter 1 n=1 Tax=Frankliniella fusca TaxID=407009 RepID=A0AAE1HY43_9NEOP|nr:Sodium-dependent glucose transporter 1 [Frankliniella fusca]
MSYRDDDDPFEEDIVFDQAGLLSSSRKSSKSAIRRVSSGKCAMFSKTLGLCGAFLGLGLTFAIPGPLAPVPPTELRHDVSLMTYELMYKCQGFMIGAMFGARMLDRFNRLFLVFLALLVTALLVTIIPWCGIAWLLRTDMFLLGVSLGFLTTGGNVLCLDLWSRNSGPFMQALHFSFSLGIFLAPFLSQPLMAPINYSVGPTSTTPAMFPLHHRLPRDIGNTAQVNSTVVDAHLTSLNSTFHLIMSANESSAAGANFSTPSTPISAVPKISEKSSALPLSSTKPSLSKSGNSSSFNAPLASMASSLAPTLAHSPSNMSVPGPLVLSGNLSVTSTVQPMVPSNLTSAIDTQKSDVSTTTHRAPRPKPVLTNSEKLQDKKWENEKFRKPPPEDLVPVSTTMKPMVRVENKTAVGNITVKPTSETNLQISNSTLASMVSSNSSRALNMSTSTLNHIVSTMSTSTLNSSLSTSLLALKSGPTVATLLPSKVSNVSNGTAENLNLHPFKLNSTAEHVPVSTLNVTAASTGVQPGTEISIAPKMQTERNETKPNLSKFNGASINSFNHSKQEPSQNITRGNVIQNNSSESTSSIIMKTEPNSHVISPELSLPLLEDIKSENDSHDIGKSISLDEQEISAINMPETEPSVSSNAKNNSKITSLPSQGPQLQLTSPQPDLLQYTSKVDVGSTVSQNSFAVKGHKSALGASTTQEPKKQPQPENIGKNMKASAPAVLNFSREGQADRNSSQPSDNHSYVPPPVSPKHLHHSKPASTVVNETTEVTHTVIDAFANRLEKYGLSRMELMYLTVGMILLATSFLFLGFLCFNPRDPKSKTDEEETNGHVARGGNRNRANSSQTLVIPSRCMRHTLIGLMMLLLMITSGVQAMYGQLLLVYSIQPPLLISQSTGTALTATFWGALTSTRFACILLASALSPTAMLVLSVAICSCATWLLSAFASSSEVALWIGSVMVSVGTASVFPSGMLWMQRHVLITHRVAAMLVMGPAMGEMFFPTLAYKMMVSMGPASLVHLPALLSLFAIALWAAVWRLARYPRQPLCSHADDSGYQLANQNDEDDLLDLTMSPIVNGNSTILRNPARSNGNGIGAHRMSA